MMASLSEGSQMAEKSTDDLKMSRYIFWCQMFFSEYTM